MKFVSILHRFWDGFWPNFRWFFDDFPVRAFTSDETSRTLFLNNSIVFCAQNQGFALWEKHEFSWFSWSFSIPVLASIFDAFWHRFWLHFGSLLAFNFHVFSRSIFEWFFRWYFLMEMAPKRVTQIAWGGTSLFPLFFETFSAGCFYMQVALGSTFGHPFGSLLASLFDPFWLHLAFGTLFWSILQKMTQNPVQQLTMSHVQQEA